jgi:hypothetical protein
VFFESDQLNVLDAFASTTRRLKASSGLLYIGRTKQAESSFPEGNSGNLAREASMKKVCGICLALTMIVAFATRAGAQKNSTPPNGAATERQRPLVLSGAVPMDGVKGRFDHFASGQGQLFVSAHLRRHC